jgi:DNA-binding NarL/FixJ family response regulator
MSTAEKTGKSAVSVLVCCEQAVVRTGLRMVIEWEPDFIVIGEVDSVDAIVEATERLQPDVALVDLELPPTGGIDAARLLVDTASSAPPVALLAAGADLDCLIEAVGVGINGVFLRSRPTRELLQGLSAVAVGEVVIAPPLLRMLLDEIVRRPHLCVSSQFLSLSKRETEVFRLLADGLSYSEIAAALFLGEATVKSHVHHVLQKLGLRDRLQAVVYAYRNGLFACDGRPDALYQAGSR